MSSSSSLSQPPRAPVAAMSPSNPNQTRRAPSLRGAFFFLAAAVLCGAVYLYVNVLNRPVADVYIAQRGTATSSVYGTVSIQPEIQLVVNAQNNGYLHYPAGWGTTTTAQGQTVAENELMATITDEATTRLLAQARVDAAAAAANLKYGAGSAGSLQSAKDKLAAYEKLPKNPQGIPQGVPRVEYESAKNDVDRLQVAVDNEKLELQRRADTYNAQVKAYQEQLQHAEVRSPMNGILVLQNYNDNAFVTANSALFTIADKRMYVSGQVNEEDVGKLEADKMKAELRLYAYGDQQFTATLNAVLPSPDANSSRYVTILHFDNPPDNLRIGLTGEMNIILGKKPNALIIPTSALLVDHVLIVKDGVVEQRKVKTGFKSLENVEITDGLDEGAQVIVADQDTFLPGNRVRAVPVNDLKPASAKKKSGK